MSPPPSVRANSATGGATALQMTITQVAARDGSSGNVTVGTYDTDVLATLTTGGHLVGTPTTLGQDPRLNFQTITYEDGGWSNGSYCYGNVWVQAVAPNGVRSFWYHPPCLATASPQLGIFRGTVTYTRFPADHDCFQGYDPSACWTYTSDASVTVTPVQATMTLSASPSIINPGDTVTFTLSLSPTQQGGFSVPFTVTANRWVPDSGADSTARCHFTGPGTCRAAIAKSGRVEVDAIVNGKTLTVSQPVVFSAVKPALTLTASPSSIVTGDTVTFVASVSPATFGSYVVPFQPKQWWWVPDDTTTPPPILADVQTRTSLAATARKGNRRVAATPGAPQAALADADSGAALPTCTDGVATCVISIGASGTMHVTAMVDGVLKEAVAHVTAVDPSQVKLVVACAPTGPTRGDIVTCTASGYPESVIPTVTLWEFQADDSVLGFVDISDNRRQLSGEIATSGKLKVEGTVRGKSATANTTIAVQPRPDWANRPVKYNLQEIHPGEAGFVLSIHPDTVSQLGLTTMSHVEGTGPANLIDASTYSIIPDGPNQGMVYMLSMYTEKLRIQVNTPAMSEFSDFWYLQPAVRTGGICSRAEMVAQVPSVYSHEGLAYEVNSHTWLYKTKLDTYDIGSKVERFVRPVGSGGVTAEVLETYLRAEHDAAYNNALLADSAAYNNWSSPCKFNYFSH